MYIFLLFFFSWWGSIGYPTLGPEKKSNYVINFDRLILILLRHPLLFDPYIKKETKTKQNKTKTLFQCALCTYGVFFGLTMALPAWISNGTYIKCDIIHPLRCKGDCAKIVVAIGAWMGMHILQETAGVISYSGPDIKALVHFFLAVNTCVG